MGFYPGRRPKAALPRATILLPLRGAERRTFHWSRPAMSFRLPTCVANSVANRSVVAFGLARSAQFRVRRRGRAPLVCCTLHLALFCDTTVS